MAIAITQSKTMPWASGTKTGVSSSTAAGRSMNMPTNSIIRFIKTMTIQAECTLAPTQAAMFWGSGLADGPVPFHYPAPDYLDDLLGAR